MIAAGCGSGPEPLTKDEYVARADAICAEANAELAEVDPGSTAAEFAEYLERTTAIVDRQLERLKELPYPAGDMETLERAIELTERQNELARELQDAAESGDRTRFGEVLLEIQPLSDEADRIVSEYGMTVCGRTGAAATASGGDDDR